jgi:hypothetical protein
MHNWFLCKVKYIKIDEQGREKKVSEPYLIDAISFSEAEKRVYQILEPYVKGGLDIASLAKSNITDVFDFNDDGVWFKSKITFLDIDPDTEKKQKITRFALVRAADVKQAYERTEESLTLIVPYEIPSVQETTIMDVFPYEIDPYKDLEGRHVVPLNDQADPETGELTEEPTPPETEGPN